MAKVKPTTTRDWRNKLDQIMATIYTEGRKLTKSKKGSTSLNLSEVENILKKKLGILCLATYS